MTSTDFDSMIPWLLCASVAIFTVESEYLILCTVLYTIRREEYHSVTSFDKLKLPMYGF